MKKFGSFVKIRHIALVALGVVFSMLLVVGPASADPSSTPPVGSLVIVGDDGGLEGLMNGVCTAYNATNPPAPCYNWDPTASRRSS